MDELKDQIERLEKDIKALVANQKNLKEEMKNNILALLPKILCSKVFLQRSYFFARSFFIDFFSKIFLQSRLFLCNGFFSKEFFFSRYFCKGVISLQGVFSKSFFSKVFLQSRLFAMGFFQRVFLQMSFFFQNIYISCFFK